jgi:tetratricopeptide (TPR) repeat protein
MLTIDEALRQAWNFHNAGNLSQAEALCRSILKSEPANVATLSLLSQICLLARRPNEAVKYLGKAQRLQPDAVDIHHYLGVARLALGQPGNAVGHFREALRLQPTLGKAHFSLANAFKQMGQFDKAIPHFQNVIQLLPNLVEAHLYLADTLQQSGDLQAAAECLRECLLRFPGCAEAHFHLGNVYCALCQHDDAIREYRAALGLSPTIVQAHTNLGVLLAAADETDEAIAHYEQAIQLQPQNVEAHYHLGNALRQRQDMASATRTYEHALLIEATYTPARDALADTCMELGDEAGAKAHWQAALREHPADVRALLGLAKAGWLTPDDPGVDQIEARLREPNLSDDVTSRLHFAAAYILDRAGEIDRAFEHFRQGNAARRALIHQCGGGFNSEEYAHWVQRLIDTFTPDYFRRTKGFGVTSELPVFIVGMPRSGTTLVEQILSNHSRVHGAGELKDIGRIVARLSSQSGLGRISSEWLGGLEAAQSREIAEAHLNRLARLGGKAIRVTDKMPVNLFHLGLIATLFPRARVIHCRRDARDVCLSCFMQFFDGLYFAWDLDDLGKYYRGYERVMAHWATALPLRVHQVVYEELVVNPDTIIRQVLNFCDLSWEDQCREFHKNTRPVRTVSRSQVRKPVYTTSVGQWQRYAAYLGPLIAALAGEPAGGSPSNITGHR